MRVLAVFLSVLAVTSCAQTSVQPLSKNSFKIDTVGAPACTPAGTRNVAFQNAAVQVIKAGYDRFIITGDQSGPGQTTVTYNPYAGLQSYTDNRQSMVVQMLSRGDRGYSNGLSAREVLGPDWQTIVAEGPTDNC